MARPRRKTFTMAQYLENIRDGYITNNASTQRNPAWKPIVDGLAVTILSDDYIPPLILSEEECGRTVIVDGGSRTAAFTMIRYGNYKIKSSVENPVVQYKKMDKDESGRVVWSDAEFDIRNKTYEQFPKELQKMFDEYQVETVIHEGNADMYLRRYNIHTAMNANQKMFVYLPAFAEKIRDISSRQFFLNYCDIKDNEKEKGMLERVIAESVMCMFHFDKWNKNGKKIATYLNDNASADEFDKLDDNLERLENVVTDETKTLFNSKDCFIWLTLFDKFTQFGLDDTKFAEFLNSFVGGLRNKAVNGKLFDTVDEIGSTKDKSVITDKLHILETLMKEFLHITDVDNTPESFVAEMVDMPVETVKEEMDCYKETLESLENNTIRDGSKLLEVANHLSLLAMVAYSYKNDVDLDKWMEIYAANNNMYLADQRKNYIRMVNDFENYNKKCNRKVGVA